MKSIEVRTLKDCLPDDVRAKPAFVLWRREQGRKIPYYTNGERRSGENGGEKDRKRLATFDQVVAAYRRGGFDGIGLALLPELNVVALDFDDCRAPDGTISEPVMAFVDESYAEISPSGTGVRVLLRGALPNSKAKGVEVFSTKGYVTLTGNRLNGTKVADLTTAMRERLATIAGKIKSKVGVDFTGVKLATKPEEIETGARNNSLLQRLKETDALRATSEQELREIALAWNARLSDPMDRREVLRVVGSTWKWFQTPEGVNRRVRVRRPGVVVSGGEWSVATAVPQEFELYTIHGVLPEAGRVVIYGPAGSMKTLLAIDIACHIALGLSWHERDVDVAAKVGYVASENPMSVHRRFRAWASDRNVSLGKLDRECFVWGGGPLDLNSPSSVAEFTTSIGGLVTLAGGVAPRVWVVDTLATAMSGDENTKAIQDAVQAIYHAIAEGIGTEPLAIFIHHTGKNEDREERGHSSLRALVDTAIRVEVGESTGDEPTKEIPSVLVKHGVATIRKQRDGVDGQQFAFEVHAILVGHDEKGRPRSQVVLRPSKDLDAARIEIAAKKGRPGPPKKTVVVSIVEAFEAMKDASGTVPFKDLLEAVAHDLEKDTDSLRVHFSRDIVRAGLKSSQPRPGVPATVRRET